METFVAVLHIAVALILITLVLLQDTKSGSVGGAFGGGGSNSVLGATGATTLAQKMTRWTAVIFAVTSIALTVFSAKQHKSVVDNLPVSAPVASPLENTGLPPAEVSKDAAPAAPTTPAADPTK